ncbi:MAG: hypothetical protein IIB88_09420 [Chloroflexi bacterium]|nr:hypothetical protein [Chloroflexota bacterium]
MVIVIAITGMLAAVAVPRMASAIANHHLNNAAQRIITDIAYAQRRARTGSMQQQIVFDAVSKHHTAEDETQDKLRNVDCFHAWCNECKPPDIPASQKCVSEPMMGIGRKGRYGSFQ